MEDTFGSGNSKATDRSYSPTRAHFESSNGGTRPAHSGGFRRQNAGETITVQPARAEDLQPKYAQVIPQTEDNPVAHGWYSALSKFLGINYYFFQPVENT